MRIKGAGPKGPARPPRIGPRITLTEQLSRAPHLRGRKLRVRVYTNEGRNLRAEEVVGKTQAELEAEMRRVDSLGEAQTDRRVEDVSPPLKEIELPEKEIIALGDIRLFPLTVGFLERHFSEELVGRMLDQPNIQLKGSHEMVGYLSIRDAFALLEIINPRLRDVRLRLPDASVIDDLLSAPKSLAGRNLKIALLLTASQHRDGKFLCYFINGEKVYIQADDNLLNGQVVFEVVSLSP